MAINNIIVQIDTENRCRVINRVHVILTTAN